MATRLYLSNDTPGYTPTTKRGAWDASGATLARKLDTAPIGTNATSGQSETSTTNNWDVLLGRWISEPVDRAGDLSGTVQGVIGALESGTNAANANMFFHLHIFVTVGDSNTVRGTVLSDWIGGTEFPTTATATALASTAITTVAVQFGDRVVVEVGYRAQNTASTNWTGTINYGSSATTTDLASGNTTTNLTSRPGWIEFSDPNAVLAHHAAWHEDLFDDGTVSTTLWPFWSGSTTVTETGGQLQITAAANNTFGYVESRARYAIKDSSVRVYMAPPSAENSSGFANARLALYDLTPGSGNTGVICYVNSVTGTIGWYATVNGVDQFDESFTPGPTTGWLITGAYFKIDETAGTLSFQVSQDGHNWIEIYTQTTPTSIRNSTRMTVDLEAIRSTASSAGTPAVFNWLNLTPPRDITWSGHTWRVRDGAGQPGPNPWGTTNSSVEVDGTDLVLKIANLGGTWTSAEVDRTGTNLGYGRYRWTYSIDVEHLDHKPVLGLYVYDQDVGAAPSQREIDLEVTKWNAASETSTMWYSVHPVADGEHRESDHAQSFAAPYTGEFIWQSGQVYLRTVDANGVLLGEHVVTQGVQAPGTEQPSMNLWLIDGAAPSNGLPVTATIHSFEFDAGVTHSLVAADTQTDDFSTPWKFAVKDGASITGGELVLPCTTGYTSAYTGSTFDLRNSSTQIEISGVPTPAGNFSQEVLWYLRHDADNYLMMFVSGGSFVGRRRQGGVNSDTSLGVHDPVAHRFWRIEVSGTTVTYKASPDGASWSTLGTATTTLTSQQLSTMRHRFECGHWATETAPNPFKVTLLGASLNLDAAAAATSIAAATTAASMSHSPSASASATASAAGSVVSTVSSPGQVARISTASATVAASMSHTPTGAVAAQRTATVSVAAAASSPAFVAAATTSTATAAASAVTTATAAAGHATTAAGSATAAATSPATASSTVTAGSATAGQVSSPASVSATSTAAASATAAAATVGVGAVAGETTATGVAVVSVSSPTSAAATSVAVVSAAAQVSSPAAGAATITAAMAVAAGPSTGVAVSTTAAGAVSAAATSPAGATAGTVAASTVIAYNPAQVVHATTAGVSAAAVAAAAGSGGVIAATTSAGTAAVLVSSPATASPVTVAAASVVASAATTGTGSVSTTVAAAADAAVLVSSPASTTAGTVADVTVSAAAATSGSADTASTVTAGVVVGADTSSPATTTAVTVAAVTAAASSATGASATAAPASTATASVAAAADSPAAATAATSTASLVTGSVSSPAAVTSTTTVAATAAGSAVTAGAGQATADTSTATVVAANTSSPTSTAATITAAVAPIVEVTSPATTAPVVVSSAVVAASASTGADGVASSHTIVGVSTAAAAVSPATVTGVSAAAAVVAAYTPAIASGTTSVGVSATAGVPATVSATVGPVATAAASIGTVAGHTTTPVVSATASVSSPAAAAAGVVAGALAAAGVGAAASVTTSSTATATAAVAYPAAVTADTIVGATVSAGVGIGVAATSTTATTATVSVSSPATAGRTTTATTAVTALVPGAVGAQVAAMATATAMVTLPSAAVQAATTVAALATALRSDTGAAQALVTATVLTAAYTGRPGALTASHGDRSGLHATHDDAAGLSATHSSRSGLEASHA